MNPSRRPPSGASVRASTSSPFTRPSSSASTRPSSSASVRPSLSATTATKQAAASRSESRATSVAQRPVSRVSVRSSTRQSSRLNPLYQLLVAKLTGLTQESDEDEFQTTVEYVSRSLDQTVRPAASIDPTAVGKQLQGYDHALRFMRYITDVYNQAYPKGSDKVSGHVCRRSTNCVPTIQGTGISRRRS